MSETEWRLGKNEVKPDTSTLKSGLETGFETKTDLLYFSSDVFSTLVQTKKSQQPLHELALNFVQISRLTQTLKFPSAEM